MGQLLPLSHKDSSARIADAAFLRMRPFYSFPMNLDFGAAVALDEKEVRKLPLALDPNYLGRLGDHLSATQALERPECYLLPYHKDFS